LFSSAQCSARHLWHLATRGRELNTYLKGDRKTAWFAIGLFVMATQASAITFLSTPGQGYLGGLGFVQFILECRLR
jgi:Na+/proline symporter